MHGSARGVFASSGSWTTRKGRSGSWSTSGRSRFPCIPSTGSQPNVFYVPPMSPPKLDAQGRPTGKPRIDPAYLESLFGKDVHQALATVEAERAKKKQGQPSELMDLLIAFDWNENFRIPVQDSTEKDPLDDRP